MNNAQIIHIKAQALKQRLLTLPVKMADTAILFTKQRFREQAWADTSTQPWKPRKAGAKRNKGRALLVSSGRLRRSIRLIRTTADSATIGSDVPYARIHNDGFRGVESVKAHTRHKYTKSRVETGKLTKTGKMGMQTVSTISGDIQVKAHTRRMNMPRRRFMGESAALRNQINRLVSSEIMKALNH